MFFFFFFWKIINHRFWKDIFRRERDTGEEERESRENIGSSRALPRGSFTLLGKPDSRHQPLSQKRGRDGKRGMEG